MVKKMGLFCILYINLLSAYLLYAYMQHRKCKDKNGRCLKVPVCPNGEHLYFTDCGDPGLTESTCDRPIQDFLEPQCDFLRCECDSPTGRNFETGQCVQITSCPGFRYVHQLHDKAWISEIQKMLAKFKGKKSKSWRMQWFDVDIHFK